MESSGNGKTNSLLDFLPACFCHKISFLQRAFSTIVFYMFCRTQSHHQSGTVFCTQPDDKIVAMLLALQWKGSKIQEAAYLSLSGVSLAR